MVFPDSWPSGSRVVPILAVNNAQQWFFRGDDGHIYSAWQSQAGGGYGSRIDMGANNVGSLCVVRASNGAFQLFAIRTDGALWTTWQSGALGAFCPWTSFGGSFNTALRAVQPARGGATIFVGTEAGTVQPNVSQVYSAGSAVAGAFSGGPSVVMADNGAMYVFLVTTSGSLQYAYQPQPLSAFSSWHSLGGTLYAGTAATIRDVNGLLHVFVLDQLGAIWHMAQSARYGSFGPAAQIAQTAGGSPAVANSSDGRLYVFYVDELGAMQVVSQSAVGGPRGAAGSLGGDFWGSPVAIKDSAGLLRVFGIDADGTMRCATQNGSSFSAFSNLGGDLDDIPSAILAVNGALQVFSVSRTGRGVSSSWQASNDGPFVPFAPLG